ncbi:SDR family oxidoreductase [Streptomyces sp. NPDC049687]|uniref:SDR family oxidoreductase n=1 Tax=Streptomyces sp. NPDC049687 TaxID=3365596 RepID=UPI0037AEECD7
MEQDVAALSRRRFPVFTSERGGTASLVTGATGFFGAALVAALLERSADEVVCLVRAPDEERARKRLLTHLDRHVPQVRGQFGRLTALAGDVTDEHLGLSGAALTALTARIGRIFHAAADVNGSLPYAALRAGNVRATLHLCDLAARSGADLHHISTTAARTDAADGIPLEHLPSGYARSKWMAEQAVAAYRRSLPAARVLIHQLGALSAHTASGVSNPADFRWLFLRACLDLRAAPLMEGGLCWLPVDCAAAAVAAVALAPDADAAGLPDPLPVTATGAVPWHDVFSWLRQDGHRLGVVSPDGWWRRLDARLRTGQDEHLLALAALAPALPAARARGDAAVWRALAALAAPETPFDRPRLRRSLRALACAP